MNLGKLTLTFFLILLLTNITISQELVLEGNVKGENDEDLKYVNIGIKNKNIGTFSNENGNFKIVLKKTYKSDSLSFSYLGYKEFTIKISEIIDENITEFILSKKPYTLDEVTILSKKKVEKKLGTKSYVGFVAGYVRANNDKNNNIREFAKELKIKKPSKILDLNINIFNVSIDSAMFRVNFYTIKDNLPYEKIGSGNIIIEKEVTEGWNKFNLEKFDVIFEKPVFITLEYLPKEFNEQDPFRYSGQVFGKSITRSSSLGEWNVKKGLTMAMYVTALQ